MVRVSFTEFEVSDGTTVRVPSAGVTLFVGPNNAGKSQSLRDLLGLAGTPQSFEGRAVTRVEMSKEGSVEEFLEWVVQNVPSVRNASGQEVRLVGEYGAIPIMQAGSGWGLQKLQHLGSLFMYHADATSRLEAGTSVANINFAAEIPNHPLQRAYIDADLEREIRKAGMAAFGERLTVDRFAGSVISLRVGPAPTYTHQDGVPSSEYMKALQELPKLEEQGDGMRSYLGLLLHILGGSHQITLVDEPEAFLHPPQARLLGKTLAQRSLKSQQLFMATHSVDVVQGTIESDSPVTIVRVTRDGSINRAAVLDPDEVRQLWSDPLLRYSNLLDGLFHDAVILCEGDADCRYYSSVLDSLYRAEAEGDRATCEAGAAESDDDKTRRRPQLLFSHCGGKARLASVTASLRAISIPVVIIADFDILNDSGTVERTVNALGGNFARIEANLTRMKAALDAKSRPLGKLILREALNKAFDEITGETVERKDAEKLRASIRIESGWDAVKQAGLSGVPQGEAHESCIALLEQLRAIGLMVVPVGELERFVPTIGGHGPKWVTEVHRQGLHDDPSNMPPREFLSEVVAATGFPRP